METEYKKKLFVRKKAFLVPAVMVAAFIVYYTVMSMLAPSRKLAELREKFTSAQKEDSDKKDRKKVDNKILTDSAYLSMIRERAFLQSRIIMAETDSIYLTIDLTDSTMNLEISGVSVHQTKMSRFRASRMFTRGDEDIIFAMLSTPLTISSDESTIRKEPVMIKMAPKDTSEYKPDIMPDTSLTEPVNYILEMTDGTRIYIYQEENDKRADRIAAFIFDIKDRLNQTWAALKAVAVFKVPDYHPFIRIRLPRADAKIIYRAIPKNGQIAIFV